MTVNTSVSHSGLWSVGRKIACIPLFFVAALAALVGYAAIAANGQLDDMAVAQIFARQAPLNQRYVKELILVSEGAVSPDQLQHTRDVLVQSAESLTRGGRVVQSLNQEDFMSVPEAPTTEIRDLLREQKRLLSELTAKADAFLKIDRDAPERKAALREILELEAKVDANAWESRTLYGENSQSKLRTMITWEAVVAVLIGVAGLAFSWFVGRNIVVPLGNVVGLSQSIAQGDLTGEKLRVTSQDEVGQLVQVSNTMYDSLRELTGQIRSVTENVNAAAAEILASTQQQAASTREQAATVQEVGSTMQEIRQSGNQVVERAKEVTAAAEAASVASGSGIQAVQGTNRTMEAIRQQVEEVAENIVALSEKTQAVGEIVATVNDIAEQSNLLALNASIEAASAGDEGSRFSVVANEMKNLADQARQCTAQVRSILGDIQKGINSSVMLTEEAVKRVETGKQQADLAERTIQDMAASTEQSVQTFQQIIGATNQQQIGIEQVTQGMQDIRLAAEQTAASTSQLERAVSNLTTMSHQLRSAVGRYRI